MKTSTSDLRTLLHGSRSAAFVDLVTMTLMDTTVARWTTSDTSIVYGGNTYTAGGTSTAPLIKRGKIREAIGLEASTLELELMCGNTAQIGGVALQLAATNGLLDDARVTVSRAYQATPGGPVVGSAVSRFVGLVSDCEADSFSVRLRVQSDLYRFEEVLPRHLIRQKCSWALGDAGCGITLASYTFTGTVATVGPPPPASTDLVIYISGAAAAKTTDYFNGGVLTFTSGALNGLSRKVTTYFQSVPLTYCQVERAFPEAPASGDTLSLVAGCDKTIATCNTTFSNLTRRRGFDFVPPPDYVTR